ncbi:MAG: hypothetical protein INH41_07475 [Myxococcaceae bacterium]|jgi:hypothetical protein|nr:hypothetical protein [Myxococcaceae bacterium]MCA3012225.1 hypothetical protein [Myxococcaceae bacterium]
MGWVAFFCCAVPLLYAWAIAAAWTRSRRGDRPLRARAADRGLVPNRGPTARERALHLPVNEAALRAAPPGPDVERIAALFRTGELARGVVFDLRDRSNDPSRFMPTYDYGWYDARGQLHTRSSHEPGLLNSRFPATNPDHPFLVAFDPTSRDHVIFFGAGLPDRFEPPPAERPPPPAPPPAAVTEPRPLPAAALDQADTLLRTLIERWDDEAQARILLDRLLELGDPRGELIALTFDATGTPSLSQLDRMKAAWNPPGGEVLRFVRGLPDVVRWHGGGDMRALAWAAARTIWCSSAFSATPTPFDLPRPRLRAIEAISTLPPRALWARVAPRLEAVSFSFHEEVMLRPLPAMLAQTTSLRRLGLSCISLDVPSLFRAVAVMALPASLAAVRLSASSATSADELRALWLQCRRAAPRYRLELDLELFRPHTGEPTSWLVVSPDTVALRSDGAPPKLEVLSLQALVDEALGRHEGA